MIITDIKGLIFESLIMDNLSNVLNEFFDRVYEAQYVNPDDIGGLGGKNVAPSIGFNPDAGGLGGLNNLPPPPFDPNAGGLGGLNATTPVSVASWSTKAMQIVNKAFNKADDMTGGKLSDTMDVASEWADKSTAAINQLKNAALDDYFKIFNKVFDSSNVDNEFIRKLGDLSISHPVVAHATLIAIPVLIAGGTAVAAYKIASSIKTKADAKSKFNSAIVQLHAAKTPEQKKEAEKNVAIFAAKYVALSETASR